ncbi:MAG: hypothetical protein ACKPKO_09290, partial [Candidatus Fonsibacter sp.]
CGRWRRSCLSTTKYQLLSSPQTARPLCSRNIMRQSLELLKPVDAIKKGVNNGLNGIVSMTGERGDPHDPLISNSTVLLCSARGDACHLRGTIRAPKLVQAATDNSQRSHDAGRDLINRKREWKALANVDNVEKLFR